MNHNQMEFKFTKKAKWLSINGCSIYSSLSKLVQVTEDYITVML